jgi:D-alanine-D-alanine ligase
MKKIAIIFGGVSAEREVSIITGLQVISNIDASLFSSFAIELRNDGRFVYYPGLKNKKDYLKIKPNEISFGKDNKGTYFISEGLLKRKVYFDSAYLALHGGNGESGQMQGFMQILDIPFTSPSVESSAISMNKIVTKDLLEVNDVKTVDYTYQLSTDIHEDIERSIKSVLSKLALPVIVKPAHLGSSIGITIAKTQIELKKALLAASLVDSEVLVEKLMKNFIELNVSVRQINNKLEVSEIEQPISKDEILSFADKYQRGGKKAGGMSSLARELPAHIPSKLQKEIIDIALKVFRIVRAKGLIRIDFMVVANKVYVTEVNPIPGSMSYYLWEASGVSFKNQITDLIQQSFVDAQSQNAKHISYSTDIVSKFINNRDR